MEGGGPHYWFWTGPPYICKHMYVYFIKIFIFGCKPSPVFLPEEFQDRGAWRVIAHRVAQSQTQLSN